MSRKRALFRVGANAGLYSEIGNMILAARWCRASGVEFVLDSAWPNFTVPGDSGWTRIFLPSCEEYQFPSAEDAARLNPRHPPANGSVGTEISRFKEEAGFQFLTWEMMGLARSPDNFNDPGFMDQVRTVCAEMYRFNDWAAEEVRKNMDVPTLPGKYAAVHIRWGDKRTEAPTLPVKRYMEKLSSITDLRDCFVMCDDYRAYQELVRSYPGWTFHTRVSPEDLGYDHEKFLKLSPQYRMEKNLFLMGAMEILARAEVVCGTRSSNPGMFLPMYMDCPERFVGVDQEKWIIF